jgi:hypothetical protein
VFVKDTAWRDILATYENNVSFTRRGKNDRKRTLKEPPPPARIMISGQIKSEDQDDFCWASGEGHILISVLTPGLYET